LKPRTAADYLPLSCRLVTEAATVVHIALWLILPALAVVRSDNYWARFAFIAVLTVGFAAYAYLPPQRRAGYVDRLFGEAYRRTELRVVCLMRLALLTTGSVGLADAVGLDVERAAHLALQIMICAMALAFVRLRPSRHGDTRSRSVALAG
jgi:hypothetical protein